MHYDNLATYFAKNPLSNLRTRYDLLQRINEIKTLIQSLSPVDDKSPDITMDQLRYYSNPNNLKGRFRSFTIPKKSGGVRIITAPQSAEYQWILRVINEMLLHVYTPSPYAMGFVKGRSVHQNARMHEGKNYVYNLDLQDFFPSIRQARVCARLQCAPFSLNRELASVIAGLVAMRLEVPLLAETHVSYVLPQGSPVSPMLTNAICDAMDRQLAGLAQRFGLTYTRYADDITFSSMHNVYQDDSEFIAELRRIITRQGFRINEKKTRLQRRSERQEVTGLVVNEHTNVNKQYVASIRNLLYIWRQYGYLAAFYKWRNYYRQHGPAYHKNHPTMLQVIFGKLMYMRMVKGKNNPTFKSLMRQYRQLLPKKIAYIEGLRVMATHRLLDFELHNRVTCCFDVAQNTETERLPYPYAYFYKGKYRHYAYIKPCDHMPRVENKFEWMIAECLDANLKLHLIIYHRNDNVYYVPNEENRLRQKLLQEKLMEHVLQRQLMEELFGEPTYEDELF